METVAFSSLKGIEQQNFLTQFSEFPTQVRKDPWRENLLNPTLLKALIETPLPVPKEFWIVKQGEKVLGTCGANVCLSCPQVGYFGFFELDMQEKQWEIVGALLFQQAEAWLKQHCVERILGPVSLSTWFPYRWRTDSADSLRLDWEPGQPSEFVQCALKAGFIPGVDFQSVGTGSPTKMAELLVPHHSRLVEQGFSFEVLKGSDVRAEHVADLHFITHEAFSGGFLFDPLPLQMFEKIYVPMINSPKHDVRIIFCMNPQGVRCGYLIGFVQEGALVFKTVANARSRSGATANVLNPMLEESLRMGLALGVREMHCALMRADNRSMLFAERFARDGGELWRHTYSLFEKKFRN